MPACFNSALAFAGLYLMPFTAVLSKYGDDGGTGEIDGSPVPASAPLLMSLRLTAYCSAWRACFDWKIPCVVHNPSWYARSLGTESTTKPPLSRVWIESGGIDQMRSTVPACSALTAGGPWVMLSNSTPASFCCFGS